MCIFQLVGERLLEVSYCQQVKTVVKNVLYKKLFLLALIATVTCGLFLCWIVMVLQLNNTPV